VQSLLAILTELTHSGVPPAIASGTPSRKTAVVDDTGFNPFDIPGGNSDCRGPQSRKSKDEILTSRPSVPGPVNHRPEGTLLLRDCLRAENSVDLDFV
jgi:hypothetical protein